ncbi:MAG: FAD-dependent oxidoreductase [Sandaracinaceae bacterium]
MPARRLPRSDDLPTVTLRVDGEDVSAIEGEPVAMSLLAAGRLVLARSVKYHRARGAACFAGRCDGCLMRVDGRPSVRTCRTAAREGMMVETQNVLGSAELDLLAATDWFFPGGMNHHEMFTWAKPVNQVMQVVARHVAGIGTLPDAPAGATDVEDVSADVLVVGAGAAGLEAARACAARGLRTLVVDEEPEPGGWLRASLPRLGPPSARMLADALVTQAREAGAEIRTRHAVVGIFDEASGERIALVDGPRRLLRVRARAWMLAQGRTEGAAAFEGSDLPGVIGAEAAARLLAHGILPGEEIVIAGDLEPRGEELEALAAALRDAGAEVYGPVDLALVERADGRNAVGSVTLRDAGRARKQRCEILVVAPRTSAAYELAGQAGARIRWQNGVFEVVPRDPGSRSRVWVVGGAAGADSIDSARAQAERAAAELADTLAAHDAAQGGPAR